MSGEDRSWCGQPKSTKKEGVQTLLGTPYVVGMRITHIPRVTDLLCVKQPEFCVSIQHKKSQKRPSALKSAYQDKRFDRAHKWHLRDCFLKVLRQVPTQLLGPQEKDLWVPTPRGPVPLSMTPSGSSCSLLAWSRRTVRRGSEDPSWCGRRP